MSAAATAPNANPLSLAPRQCRGAFVWLALFSGCFNLLMLTAPLYMLQVFDRVLASRSLDTLALLTLVAAFALLALAGLEGVRSFVLIGIAGWLDGRLSGPVLEASVSGALRDNGPSVQGLRDLTAFRNFVAGPSMFPLMDVPWTPMFIAVVSVLSPVLGWIAVVGSVLLLALAIANELATRALLAESGTAQVHAMQEAEAAIRNADVIEAMGMMNNLTRRWRQQSGEALVLQARASARSGIISATSKFIRLGLQIGMLGVGPGW